MKVTRSSKTGTLVRFPLCFRRVFITSSDVPLLCEDSDGDLYVLTIRSMNSDLQAVAAHLAISAAAGLLCPDSALLMPESITRRRDNFAVCMNHSASRDGWCQNR